MKNLLCQPTVPSCPINRWGWWALCWAGRKYEKSCQISVLCSAVSSSSSLPRLQHNFTKLVILVESNFMNSCSSSELKTEIDKIKTNYDLQILSLRWIFPVSSLFIYFIREFIKGNFLWVRLKRFFLIQIEKKYFILLWSLISYLFFSRISKQKWRQW